MIDLKILDLVLTELELAASTGGEPLDDEFIKDTKKHITEVLKEMGHIPGFEDDHLTGIKIVLRDFFAWADSFDLDEKDHKQLRIAMDYMDDIDPLLEPRAA